MIKITEITEKQTLIVLIVIVLISFGLAFACVRQVNKYEEKTGKTLIYKLGEEVSKKTNEFKNGYNSDTLN